MGRTAYCSAVCAAWPARATWLAGLVLIAGLALMTGLALMAGLAPQAQAQDLGNYQVTGSVAAYLGVMPAEIVGGHPAKHPETRMHGGPPNGAHAEHVVIALFEEPSGTRIEDATVVATFAGLGETAVTPVTLDPMPIAGVITYGGYVRFPGRDTYIIELAITRPGSPSVTQMRFTYAHGGN